MGRRSPVARNALRSVFLGQPVADVDREKFTYPFEGSKTIASAGTGAPVAVAKWDELENLCIGAKGLSRSMGTLRAEGPSPPQPYKP
jgi:hypothetical protein